MNKKIIFQNEKNNIKIELDEDNKIITIMLVGEVGLEEYKNGFLTFLDLVEKYDCKKAIFDMSKNNKSPLLGRTWFVTSYLRKATPILKKGEKVAIIKSSNLVQAMTTDFVISTVTKFGIGFEMKVFKKREEAEEWLQL